VEDLDTEIQELIEDGEVQGIISAEEGTLINSILEFKETLVREIMTPRAAMVCAPATAGTDELIDLIITRGFTRIPIYNETLDKISGVLHAKDLLKLRVTSEGSAVAGEICNPAVFVMEHHKIIDLLRDFKTKKIHLAIVTDEFGGVRGLVTLEDILEEIVGEITDEYDQDTSRWTVVDPDTVLSDAKIDIEEVEDFFNITLPEGPYESIGGLIIHHLGRLPQGGESVHSGDLLFQVLSVDKRKINTVKIKKIIS